MASQKPSWLNLSDEHIGHLLAPGDSLYISKTQIRFEVNTSENENGVSSVTAVGGPLMLTVRHAKLNVAYELTCGLHRCLFTTVVSREDLAELDKTYDFPDMLAEAVSKKCYAEKGSHCNHFKKFLRNVREMACQQSNFMVQVLISLGPIPEEPYAGPSLDPTVEPLNLLKNSEQELSDAQLAQPAAMLYNQFRELEQRIAESFLSDVTPDEMKISAGYPSSADLAKSLIASSKKSD